MVIRPLIDRFMIFGILPEVEEYFVNWPDLNAPGEKEIAEVADKKTQALAKYVAGSVDEIFTPEEYLKMIMKMEEEDVDIIIKAASKYKETLEEEPEEIVPSGVKEEEVEEEEPEE